MKQRPKSLKKLSPQMQQEAITLMSLNLQIALLQNEVVRKVPSSGIKDNVIPFKKSG